MSYNGKSPVSLEPTDFALDTLGDTLRDVSDTLAERNKADFEEIARAADYQSLAGVLKAASRLRKTEAQMRALFNARRVLAQLNDEPRKDEESDSYAKPVPVVDYQDRNNWER